MDREPGGVEKLIQDAQKEGKFDDLERKGQPLHVGFGDLASVFADVMRDNGVVPEWIELTRGIEALQQRQSELTAALERRRAGDREELNRALASWTAPLRTGGPALGAALRRWWLGDRAEQARRASDPPGIMERMEKDRRRTLFQVAQLVREERKKVDRYNVVAISGRQLRRVRVDERLTEFQERFPSLSLIESDGNWLIQERVEPVDPALLPTTAEEERSRPQRTTEQVAALQSLRTGQRKPPPIG